MPLTYTGRIVRPGGTEHPSLVDIAVGLSRQPRFAGQTRRQWSVLDHTLFCDELVQQRWPNDNRKLRLALLLHDAHEAMTADVPTDMKPAGLKDHQHELDAGIFEAYFPGGFPFFKERGYTFEIKDIDRLALIAEAHVVGPPSSPERVTALFGSAEGATEAETLLRSLLVSAAIFGRPPWATEQEAHPAVREYLARMNTLM